MEERLLQITRAVVNIHRCEEEMRTWHNDGTTVIVHDYKQRLVYAWAGYMDWLMELHYRLHEEEHAVISKTVSA